MIEPALTWAGMKHKGQVRKYTGEPYMTHPEAVYRLVSDHLGVAMTDTIGVSAILHDVVEDTSATIEEVLELFGETVAEYVWYLTKPPEFVGVRSIRKEHDRWRLSVAPEEVKIIKFFDIYHNASSIEKHDPELWEVWRRESALLLLAMDINNIKSIMEEYSEFVNSL
jgi:(p)ppGpp synthase/HD superfamily hydrolase